MMALPQQCLVFPHLPVFGLSACVCTVGVVPTFQCRHPTVPRTYHNMVLESPQSGRCNARITSPESIELRDTSNADTDTSTYDIDRDNETHLAAGDDVHAVRLVSPDGDAILDSVGLYTAVQEYVARDYELLGAAITESVSDTLASVADATVTDECPPLTGEQVDPHRVYSQTDTGSITVPDTAVWADFTAPNTNVRVSYPTTTLDGYCERWPAGGDADRCHAHTASHDGSHSAANRIEHGMYAKRTNYWQAMDDADRQFVEAMVDSWLADAPFDRGNVGKLNDLYRAAIDQHRAWQGVDEFVADDEIQGMVTETPVLDDEGDVVRGEDGDPVTVEEEHPANLPLARLDKAVVSKLKKLGVLDDPDSQQADATESLAQKLSSDND